MSIGEKFEGWMDTPPTKKEVEFAEKYIRNANSAAAFYAGYKLAKSERKLKKKAKKDGWITWSGGDCPVDKGASAYIKFRSGTITLTDYSSDWVWNHYGGDNEIIAYRIIKEAPKQSQQEKPKQLPQKCTDPSNKECHALYNGDCMCNPSPQCEPSQPDWTIAHPWSEPVPRDGHYLVLNYRNDLWVNIYIIKDKQEEGRIWYTHWMHEPPKPKGNE